MCIMGNGDDPPNHIPSPDENKIIALNNLPMDQFLSNLVHP